MNRWRRYVALGDSLTVGTGDYGTDHQPVGWAKRLSYLVDMYAGPCTFMNLAQGGATTRDVLGFQLWRGAIRDPGLVTVTAGMNDIQERHFYPQKTAHYLDTIFTMLERTLDPTMLTWTYPEGVAERLAAFSIEIIGGEYHVIIDQEDLRLMQWRIGLLNDLIRKVAADSGVLVLDLGAMLIGDAQGPPEELFSPDGLHPSPEGHRLAAMLAAGLLDWERGRS